MDGALVLKKVYCNYPQRNKRLCLMFKVKVFKRLKQKDPLAPYMFLLAYEGIDGMIQKAISGGLYSPFKVKDEVQMSLLQYTDDRIFVAESITSNLRIIKALLYYFGLLSRL
ncbi:hypothetical protein VNO77_13835 [Canavalia gladiata]|uniref:Reverse transcriptase domain-containing protein n=1 Tax=Canavalia gladiata TaxID=3824 RepID=A0AAN9QQQ5_CANGL